MRSKITYQESLGYDPSCSVQIVQDYVNKYKGIDTILQANPEILECVHGDFTRGLSRSQKGREGDYTTEQIFRSIVVMFIEPWSYRRTVVHIDTNVVLQRFVRLGMLPMMDFTFWNKAYCALSETTWEKINRALSRYAHEEEKIGGEKLRVDSTVYETNIHYPTDSSLLWDSYRTLARLLRRMREEMRAVGLEHRFHTRKVKKLAYYISRNGGSKSKRTQQKVKSMYRLLIERVRGIVRVARTGVQRLSGRCLDEVAELEHYLPLGEKIIHQAEKRILEGVILPAEEKVYSVFEDHTELLKRGKAGKEVEFGHKILIAQNGEKFITHYQALLKRKEDKELLKETLAAHKNWFGKAPSVLATDRGFYESRNQLKELEREIRTVSMAKKGSRTPEEKARESTEEFQEGQRFRAGSEGSISVLKRAYKLRKCLFKGFKNFAVSVGCAVFCHNLVLLTQL